MSCHKHQCSGCGAVWEHDNLMLFAPPDLHAAAHACPACGSADNTSRADRALVVTHAHPVQAWTRAQEFAEVRA